MLNRFLIALPLTMLALPAWAEEIVAQSHVSAVTVFADRATVTRTAQIDLPKGANTVVFEGLPETLFSDSLRTEGESQADVVLGALESKTVSSAELAAPRERELNTKLQSLQDQRALVVADQGALQQKQTFLQTLGQQGALRSKENIAAIDLKPEQWTGAANALSASVSDTLRALAGKDVELRNLDEQIAAVEQDLSQLQTGAHSSVEVRIPVESNAAAKLSVRVSYQVPNAAWAPIYDARLETASGKLSLVQYGEVRQNTGEDWSNVKLTLSTAQPARGAALPALDPMWVNLYAPYAARRLSTMEFDKARSNMAGQVAAPMAADAMMEMAVAAPAPAMKAASFVAATLNAGGYVTEYGIAGTSTVLADGTARKVMVGGLDVSSELVAKIKPQVASSAFLVAVTKLGGEAPLLPGSASLFRDGAFIGSAQLPMLRPGEETDLGFGVDDQIVVKPRLVKDESGEAGVITKDSTRIRQSLLEVQNLHRTPVKVAVLQTVPAPQDEKITFALDKEYTTPGYTENVDHITGQLRWISTLAPQQKWDVKLGWTLSWPKDSQINGLPF